MSFKDHFSAHAALYSQARPIYPAQLFAWLATQVPSFALAWDVGSGNGQVAVALAEYFDQVVASDPSSEQLAQARAHARVDYRVEPAEHGSLEDASADLVTVGQALHWFDHPAFFAEVDRVLKPGGLFAAWSYADVHVTPAVDMHIERLYRDITDPYWAPERDHVDNGYADIVMPFEPVAHPDFGMRVPWSAAQLLAYLRSWSASQHYRRDKGHDPVSLVEEDLLQAWGNPDQPRPVHWDFHLHVRSKPAHG
ncbi:MAG: class I SAM-dependent methyltransferase [Rhodanobacteraceae bacterium]